MNVLSADGITKAYGERRLFDKANFYLAEGEKVGILGINGTGKSTLLKIIAGLEEPDEGTVTRANGYLVKYLSQDPKFPDEETVLEAVLWEAAAIGNRRSQQASLDEGLAVEAKSMLTRLGVTEFLQPCGQLSGGQKKRLKLVSALLSRAEILVLDEPTNHLDNEMSDWLEEMLKKRKGAVVMVTHDRYFLDGVAGRIVELDRGRLYSYETNYSGYLELKAQREEMEQASERKRISILRNELAWVQRGARARSTKQKARLERYEELREHQDPVSQVELSSIFTRLGKITVELKHICKTYGERKLIDDFTHIFFIR